MTWNNEFNFSFDIYGNYLAKFSLYTPGNQLISSISSELTDPDSLL